MAEASNLKKAGTGKSGLGILLIAVGVVALIAVVVWALTNPDILEATINVIIIIVVAIVVIALIIAGVMLLMAIPLYVKKGEQYQENVDYSIDDVKSVKESSSEDKKNE
ncbi:MAG: hypothetical protein IJV47_01450 [Candidatus Methanomethylophilaceae archaeon]|nr:hypothetical protein [Candidatus Methanomethylophilaceae archaeon]MBQ7979817.1 hypothetical protein [Candidatus Methanomethylophilaceae archaeon]MBQ9689263.1 hypothetical protein [Candidatus Methanomethylophilaceae archaeon]MBR1451871.1 hypothetical protein [Candidatus Methanomethylophilaceae archaeon]MBR4203784.1 hypothetical protein [Candidatus Methanomethylophilaceae archaeon]